MKKTKILLSILTVIGLASCDKLPTETVKPSESAKPSETVRPSESIKPSESVSNSVSNIISTPSEQLKVKTIDILKDDLSIEELNVFVGESFTLTTLCNDNLTPNVTFESSNPEAISISSTGLVTINDKGDAIISVTVNDLPYITDSIYIKATKKIEQLGIGSGLTANDPIFLGNEGEDEPIEVRFIEMQHIYGDSIFIKKGNVEILIDAGYEYDGKFVKQVVEAYCADDRLDVLMVSHSDGDHIDGLSNALSAIENVSLMVDYGGVGKSTVAQARKTFIEKGMEYHSAYDCVNKLNGATDRYYLTSEFYFDVLDTGQYVTSDAGSAGNGKSLSVIFHYKDFSFFTAGDLTTASEEALMKREELPEVTLYKASHHGSHGSNSQELLDTLNPKAVAISAARAGSYSGTPGAPNPNVTTNLNGASGHPAAEAIGRIYKAPNISQNLNVYWNAVNGTMCFTSYGTNDFTFHGSATMRGYYDLTLTNGEPVWNESIKNFENKVTGEENYKLHQTKVFTFRDYIQYLPEWAQKEYYPNYNK